MAATMFSTASAVVRMPSEASALGIQIAHEIADARAKNRPSC
jgi:hypothetical protein